MAILEKTVMVRLNIKNIKHFESMGIRLPKVKNKQLPTWVKIEVTINELPEFSSVKLTKICDICGIQIPSQPYRQILKYRQRGDGLDRCSSCGNSYKEYIRTKNVPFEKSLAYYAILNNIKLLLEYDLEKNDLSPHEIYPNSARVIHWICSVCGSSYSALPTNRARNMSNCPYCAGKKINRTNCLATTHPHIAAEWDYDKNKNITPDMVIHGSTKIFYWQCISCNDSYPASVNKRTNKSDARGCPRCKESKGEKFIREYLTQNNIPFRAQYTFDDLLSRKGNKLRFDFGMLDKNNQLICLIEYDGEFHFRKIYKKDGFETTQYHDQLKNAYCKDNNIPLIRIPYWESNNIKQILSKEFSQIGGNSIWQYKNHTA